MNLKAELKTASLGKGEGQSSARQLEQSHRYTLQLERQLRHYLARGNSNREYGYVWGCGRNSNSECGVWSEQQQ